MKGRLVAFVGIFCIAILVVSAANAVKPPKEPKPDKTTTECISFLGPDLVGSQQVEGCCPNAGPFPTYTMELPNGLGSNSPGIYIGQLFINYYGVGRNKKYIVQFGNDDIGMGMEIIGGDIVYDKKTKVLTVTFTPGNSTCTDHVAGITVPVEFTLVRTPDLTDCPAP